MFFNSASEHSNEADDRLIAKFKSTGDLEFLGKLFDKYMHLVYGVCLKYLKEREASQDATMQIFEKLIVELPKRDVENFKPWLHVITKNHCLMQLRSQKIKFAQQEKLVSEQDYFMESSFELHHNNEPVLEQDLEMLRKCIDQLKTEQKECVSLFYLEEKCYQEISDELSVEIKKVKSFIQNGKRNLKICMEKNG
ncbi:MAG: sigma-70 family RNA polymerase sigma factor [Cyclobacteriaceae bacterium]|nr:sigma-70 family RNA polymerase sigma factor [Cyclobacteriaceae bacterium]MCK5281410.1 sigma-70 family RNA polymerase sigma factor [Cyclobacteriaceae bacterium]MCK5369978.1 sigma-70 family RNA polymerase sigma factor [Cyclobacteriaceae bacterium]MCK5468115.1 sigma-70 family RNA polymerase sigma factor [Cyclobacteriaceae bacterium]